LQKSLIRESLLEEPQLSVTQKDLKQLLCKS